MLAKLRNNSFEEIKRKTQMRFLRISKELYHIVSPRVDQKRILMIIGCQRSGTTLMTRIFERDLRVKIYGELDPKMFSQVTNNHRMLSLETVQSQIKSDRLQTIVLKPLVETQNMPTLEDAFPEAKFLWMFRSYVDVASSNLKRFGERNGINNLRPIVEASTHNWRAEHVSADLRRLVLRHFSEDMNPYDAAALFWYIRNTFFFSLNLQANPKVLMCRYDRLVQNPLDTTQKIYKFFDQPFPGEKIIGEVHASSVGKGKHIPLSSEIRGLCDDMLDRLNQAYETQTPI